VIASRLQGTLLVVVTCAAGCRGRDDEAAIRAMIGDAARLAEKHDAFSILDLATEDFVAEPGALDRHEVQGVLQQAFLRYGRFTILTPRPSVEISPPDMAEARVPFVVVRAGTAIPDLGGLVEDHERWIEEAARTADPYVLELSFLKTGGRWKVSGASIEDL
jgi:hypothetical protein